jgi:iron complex outermembrane recepter protein
MASNHPLVLMNVLRMLFLGNKFPALTPASFLNRWRLRLATGSSFCALLAFALPATAAEPGLISGTVSNVATGNLLEGARVVLPQLGHSVFTDATGRYVLAEIPAGAYNLEVTYIGLDAVRAPVTVEAGGRVQRNFDLTTAIYKMEAFRVAGEREGDAAAITQQRNAENMKNIVAMDSFGNLPNMSAGEVVMRLPGVAGSPTDEGLAYWFNIRGMDPQLNSVTIDGGVLPSVNVNRTFQLQSITGTMFEALELTKGHRPDTGAASLGGTINLKTRSPLTMREKRRTTYSLTSRIAPAFFEQMPLREQHRAHPLASLAHQEVFDVFGGTRNLAVSLNLFYSENAVGGASTTLDYQNTLAPTAYVWDFRQWDNINNRKQTSVNLRTDYQWSPTTRFSVTLLGNDNFERHRRRMEVRAFTGNANTVPNATTTGVVPGQFTDKITVVRPVAASTIDILMDGPLNFYVRTRQVDFTGEHEYRRWQIDYAGGMGYTNLNNGQGTAGQLTMRLAGAGWILDRTGSDVFPRFLQNGGPDFLSPDNYRPTANGLTNTNNQADQSVKQFRFNTRYAAPLATPLFLKVGGAWLEQGLDSWGKDNHRWSYIGGGPLAPDPNLLGYYARETGLRLPRWQSHMFMNERRPRDPAAWREDRYYHETQKFTATRGLTESTSAAYAMAQGRLGRDGFLGRTGYLGGVRVEGTTVDSWGWVRSRALSTAAQQTADPAGSAARDYANNAREIHGKYTNAFPSLHAYHDLTPGLKLRSSFSTSYGRAALNNFFVTETPDEANQRLSVNNPGLKPQTAKNWDTSLEYYFEPVGQLSLGWFHKEIHDYIIDNQEIRIIPSGPDNGYDGEYAGWTERTSVNGGTAVAQGWEFSYRQQFTFLPGLLKGLAGSFNYTWIDTHGMFDGNVYLTRHEVPGFIPYAANASLSWRYRKFSARILYNFTGEHITAYNATSPALHLYRFSMKTVNVGVGYQVSPSLGFSFDVANLFNEPQAFYRGFKSRSQRTLSNFVTVTAGVNGRF